MDLKSRTSSGPGINHPQASTDAEVLVETLQDATGKLCWCDGAGVIPDPYSSNPMIGLVINADLEVEETPESLFSKVMSGEGTLVYSEGAAQGEFVWSCNSQLLAQAVQAGGPAGNNNKLWAFAYYEYSPPYGPEDAEIQSVPFRGVAATSCTALRSGAESCARLVQRTAFRMPGMRVDAGPTGGRHGALEFSNLSVDTLLGNRLMLGGKPLRASTLAVSAFDVAWWHGAPARLVRRAIGHVNAASPASGWVFPNSPEASIIIWQGDFARRHVLLSENPEQPDILDLDPTRDVFAIVNFRIPELLTQRGGFSLSVKVLA